MIFQPTNVYPSLLGGNENGTIDVTKDLTVSWQINGESGLTGYIIQIYENTAASTLKLTVTKTLSSAVYGRDYNGNIQMFSADAITAAQLSSAGIVNGFASGYKLVITQIYGASSTRQSSASPFITRAEPTLSIDTVPATITQRFYTFTGTYSQAQSDTVNSFRWVLSDSENNVIRDTGNIYGTQDIKFYYDGFYNGESYTLKLYVETQSGISKSAETSFTVAYTGAVISGYLDAQKLCDENCVQVSWGGVSIIDGVASGYVAAGNGEAFIDTGASVTWDTVNNSSMYFEAPWCVVWRGKCDIANGSQTLLEINPNMKLKLYDMQGRRWFDVDYNGASTFDYVYVDTDKSLTYTVIMTNGRMYVCADGFKGGLYPKTNLYPSASLYPRASGVLYHKVFDGATIPMPDFDITSVKLIGRQTCDYVWIVKGSLSSATITEIKTYSNTFKPNFSADTYLCANFDYGLSGGNYDTRGASIIGAALYRKDGDSTQLKRICDLPSTQSIFRDYGVRSQQPCKYYCFPYSASAFASDAFISDEISPCFWDWTIDCTERNSDGVFHVIDEFRFKLDVSTEAISNNAKTSISDTFTGYPSVQISPSKYASGSFSAYIGKTTVNNEYVDSVELAEKIKSLSAFKGHQFLRNRKGNLWKIRVTDVSIQTGDKYAQQPLTATINWVEVADSSDCSIVLTQDDAAWVVDDIVNSSFAVNIATGELIWTIPDNYNGSDMYMSVNGELIRSFEDKYENTELMLNDNNELIANY